MMSTLTIFIKENGSICARADDNVDRSTDLHIPLQQELAPNWHHLAVVVTSSNMMMMDAITIYLNGTASPTLRLVSIISDNTKLNVGGNKIDASAFFEKDYEGLMQDVGLFPRILSPSEITYLAEGALSQSGASFLPQCLCATNTTANLNSYNQQQCADGSNRSVPH